jgi:uncharacterized membrane protein (UPF0127 family)
MIAKLFMLLGSAALGACSPASEAQVASGSAKTGPATATVDRHPLSGLQVIDLQVQSGETMHAFRVELAASDEAQARGLMFRNELGDFEGMLFPSDGPEPRSFWMKNTPLSLDIIFVGIDGRITNIAANTEPYSLLSVSSAGLTSAVLELRGGRAAALGIEPGDEVEYSLPD